MIFKRTEKEGLDKALALCLITKKECLELKFKRAESELANYTKIKVPVKKETKTKTRIRV